MYLEDERTALYRFYDGDGALLYVGITYDLDQRWASHRNSSPWWERAVSNSVEWYDNRRAALDAELEAIRTERPLHNLAGSPWAPGPRALQANEKTQGQLRANLTEHCQRTRYTGEAVVVVDRSKERKPAAVLVPFEFYERALAALDEEAVPAKS